VAVELRKERLLRTIVFPVVSCMVGSFSLAVCMLIVLANSLKESILMMPYQYILPGAAFTGCLLGLIIAGSKISKPFPFGPALAIAAMISIFRHE